MEFEKYVFAFFWAVIAGFINAIAGGGTLLTFPFLTSMGLTPVVANVTNTIALFPGTLGGAFGQRSELKHQKHRILKMALPAALGGAVGGILLIVTNEKVFTFLVPYLILMASVLMAFQSKIKRWLASINSDNTTDKNSLIVAVVIFIAALYGGYFGAGLGIILMAVLGLLINDTIPSLNFIKQLLAFFINFAAAIYFSFSGIVNWPFAIVMALGAIVGGIIGGRFSGKIRPDWLRVFIVITGVTVAVIFWLKS